VPWRPSGEVVSAGIFTNRAKFRVILDRDPIRAFLRVFRNPEKGNGGQDGEIGDGHQRVRETKLPFFI